MKKSDSQKLDSILTMLADMVEVFGKRFDKINERLDPHEASHRPHHVQKTL